MEDLTVGDRVTIRQSAWDEARRKQGLDVWRNPGVQVVSEIGTHPPFDGMIMLSFPLWWWKPEDLEKV